MSIGVPDERLELDALAFFSQFEAAAAEAVRRSSPGVSLDLAMGHSRVRLRFASAAFAAAAIPALDHLEARPGIAPDAVITVWDSASTGVPAPDFPWSDLAPRGTPIGFGHPSLRTIVDPDFGGVTMFDTTSRAGVVWAPAALELPWWERAAPLRAALCWASVQPGQHFVHGGAVGGPAGGVLLAGRGGSGKSTLALACVEHGMGYAGDDYVLVTTSPARWPTRSTGARRSTRRA